MKKIVALLCAGLILATETKLTAADLIYTSNQTNYQATNYVFRINAKAKGFVRLNNGFTVLPDACANLDLLFSVSGFIDLRETGTMLLLHDLIFDKWVSFSSGGNINGQGNVIKLNDNLTIPSNKVLHINGNTIIDGQRCALIIGANAQIFVDTNVTLTLRNMSLTNYQHAPTFPPIRCGATTSKLALDNVILEPCGDFLFPQGQLFIHHDVMVTGTSAFIYTSPVPSFITSDACWYFDIGTTLSVAPASFTDAPYSLLTTYTDNNFINMADATSVLYLNGCSLQTTLTGCRFTQGTIAFDNKVVCKSDTTLTLTALTFRTLNSFGGNYVATVNWSPNGRYLAVGAVGGGIEFEIFRFNGTTLSLVTSVDYGDEGLYSLNWSPDGSYLAVGGDDNLRPASGVFRFDGTTLSRITTAIGNFNSYANSVNWSPDGQYLAAGGRGPGSTRFLVYQFNGTRLNPLTATQISFGTSVNSVNWTQNGKYIALGGSGASSHAEFQVYQFNGTSLTITSSVHYGTTVYTVNWSPDGRYLAVGGNGSISNAELQIYRFDGTSLTITTSLHYGTTVYAVNWSPDGRYLAIGGQTSSGTHQELEVYQFNGTSLSLIPGSQVNYGSYVAAVNWSQDGAFLALGGRLPGTGHNKTEVYTSNYVNNTVTQALSDGIVFGNSAKGNAYDVHLNVLAGAHVNLFGNMSYDNVN